MIVKKQMECILEGETEVLGENLPQRHFCPSKIPHDQTRVLTRAAALGSRRLFFFIIIWFVRLLALRPLLAYCASLG
jgi:hypothetical protein